MAENEKIKGNDAMKTKDFDEAIRNYSLSIKLDRSEPTSYCNRALALIKLKQFEKGLSDCNEAIKLKRDYSKAYYRRSLCYIGLRKFQEGFDDLILILKETPKSKEIIDELNTCLGKWKEEMGKDGFSMLEQELRQKIEEANNTTNKTNIFNSIPAQNNKLQGKQDPSNNNIKNESEFKRIKIIESRFKR